MPRENPPSFVVYEGNGYSVFCESTIAGSETCTLQALDPDGNWVTIIDEFFTATKREQAIYSKGVYRVVKPVTASAVGVFAFTSSFNQKGRK